MTRNKIETHRRIFEKLSAKLPIGVSGLKLGPNVRRWVETDPNEAKSIEDCIVHHVVQSLPDRFAIVVSNGGQAYVALTESRPHGGVPLMDGLVGSAHEHAGLLTVLLSLDTFQVNDVADIGIEIAETIFGIDGAYPLEMIRRYFRDVEVWEIDPARLDPTKVSTAFRVHGARLASMPGSVTLSFDPAVLAKILRVFESDAGLFVAEAAMRGLTAVHWEHAFLEFYRCLERLYPVPYLESLRMALSAPSHQQVYAMVEQHLGWAPREEPALSQLLMACPETVTNALYTLLLPMPAQPAADVPAATARLVYKIRNEIAHFRRASTAPAARPWSELIGHLCDIIVDLYTRYAPALAS